MKIIALSALGFFLLLPGFAEAQQQPWGYREYKDDFDDKRSTSASARTGGYQYNNDFYVSFLCTDGKVRFDIGADTLINSKGNTFNFTFRVDDKPTKTISLKTFHNSGEGGYTYDDVADIAGDILGGSKMRVRAVTWNNDYLDTTISLVASDENIRRVFQDCGITLPDAHTSSTNQTDPRDDFSFDQILQELLLNNGKKR